MGLPTGRSTNAQDVASNTICSIFNILRVLVNVVKDYFLVSTITDTAIPKIPFLKLWNHTYRETKNWPECVMSLQRKWKDLASFHCCLKQAAVMLCSGTLIFSVCPKTWPQLGTYDLYVPDLYVVKFTAVFIQTCLLHFMMLSRMHLLMWKNIGWKAPIPSHHQRNASRR